jgi:hypothetical protein
MLPRILPVLAITVLGLAGRAAAQSPQEREFFENKIRPLLADNCFKCHSAGGNKKGDLHLDSRAALLKGGETGPAVAPGDPAKSLLVKAVGYGDPDLRMPPRKKLSAPQIADLTAWVKMGAPWPDDGGTKTAKVAAFDLNERKKHWAWQPVRVVPPGAVQRRDWVQSPVDHYLLAALEAKGLSPAPPADKRTLLRRVTFDLIGLPPTPAEIDAFLKDESPQAFARVVDRLLASPHYGERWGRHWLDLARFAETYGHEFDVNIPEAYRYRDYVIRAFNADLPYDQFVTEHVAGDLLPRPRRHPIEGTNESILGTGFFLLGEAKHSPVDSRGDHADRLDNQIDVFSKTFLGLTVACARCHDHKFDAIRQKDYYALSGYLQSARFQRAFLDDPGPLRQRVCELRDARKQRDKAAEEMSARLLRENAKVLARYLLTLRVGRPDLAAPGYEVFADFTRDGLKGWFVSGPAFGVSTATPVEVRADRASPVQRVHSPGLAHSGLVSDRLAGSIRSPTFTIGMKKILYRVAGRGGQVRLILDGLQLIQEPIYGGLAFGINNTDLHWHVQDVSMWAGHRAYIEVLDDGPGYAAIEQILFSDNGPPPEAPLAKPRDEAKARAWVEHVAEQWQAGTLGVGPTKLHDVLLLNELLRSDVLARLPSAEQPPSALFDKVKQIEEALPTPRRGLALAEGTPVDEHVFIRGSHKKLGEVAPRRFLEAIVGDTPGGDRLDLARRLLDPSCPLVPRVLVNRIWQHHFGEGIVRSVDDFGVLGQRPTHPELLDFLAAEFVGQGWSIKRMHRLMLLSSAYQMASAADPEADKIDPENKLIHRMPVRRLEAECVRDAILAVSGRLDRTMYGPGVLPHLTPFMTGRGRPTTSGPLDGAGRRSIYVNVRRNFLTPLFLAFDYPVPFSTMGRRSVSNVPAQALTLMNNPFVEQQAGLWARHVRQEKDARKRVASMYEAALGRLPSVEETADALAFVGGGDDECGWGDLAHALFNVKEFIFVH